MLYDHNNSFEFANSRAEFTKAPKVTFHNLRGSWHKITEQRLWAQADAGSVRSELQGRGFIVGFDGSDILPLRQSLNAAGIDPDAGTGTILELNDIANSNADYSILVVNMDAFSSIDAGVDALLQFRDMRPDVTVVVASSAVAGDDLETSRRVICDATLRLPVSSDRLEKGLSAAVENNTAYRRSLNKLPI
jgi:hypothetical protein